MPIYAYKCDACGKPHDALQKMSDAPLTLCPHCGAAALTKQVTAAGFQLKGSGWYVTDFRDGGKAATKPGDSDKAADKPSEKAADKAADKPAETAKASDSSAPAAAPSAAPSPASSPSPAPASTGSTPTQG